MRKRLRFTTAAVTALALFAGCVCPASAIPQVWANTVMSNAAVTSLPATGVLAPSALARAGDGTLYVADSEHHVIWHRLKDGSYIRAAGTRDSSGYANGDADASLFDSPWDIVAYQDGFAISDTENHVIRFLHDGKVETLAGSGEAAKVNGKGAKASFHRPTGLAVGRDGELYIADTENHVIRVMDKKGKVRVYAGSSKGCADGSLKKARFEEPTGLYYAGNALYVADSGNHRICKIKNGKVTTIAGSKKGVEGNVNGKAARTRLSSPQGVYVYGGVVYIADTGNGYVKKLDSGKVTNVVRAYTMKNGLLPVAPRGLAVKGGYLFVGDVYAQQLIKIKLSVKNK